MFAKILSVALLIVCISAAPQYYHEGHATSYASVTQHQTHHVIPVKTIAVAPVVHHAVHAVPVVHAAPIVHATPVVIKSEHHEEHYAHPKYEFKYGVEDHHTGDIKSQEESRDGDVVKGQYSVHEPDGTILTVHYTADKHSGFNAVVHREGHASHPQHVAKAVVAVPVHHVVAVPTLHH